MMNDNTKIRRYYKSKLDEIPGIVPPVAIIKSVADSNGSRPASKWKTVFGFLVTFGYLLYFFNPYYWFSLCRFFLSLMNGFSFGRFIWGFGIGL